MHGWNEISLADGIRVVETPDIHGFFQFIETGLGEADAVFLWRGQRNSEWLVTSTLGRCGKNELNQILNYRAAVARCTSKEFNLEGQDCENTKLRLWSIGQHYGLLTPLIDWTTYPFIALFFAFVEPESETCCNELRAVFALSTHDVAGLNFLITETFGIQSFKQQLYNPPYPDEFKGYLLKNFGFGPNNKDLVLESKIPEDVRQRLCSLEIDNLKKNQLRWFTPSTNENPRLHSQGGCHCYTPGDTSVEAWIREKQVMRPKVLEKVPVMTKILIPNSQRKSILSALNRMNVNWLSLFPDFEGAARHCNLTLLEGRFEGGRNY